MATPSLRKYRKEPGKDGMKYVYTQNLTQDGTASRSADPVIRKGHCEGWNAALFHYSRRSDPLCSRLSNLYDHKTGLGPPSSRA